MIKITRLAAAALCAAAVFSSTLLAKNTDWTINSMVRYESHSDETNAAGGTDDDFIYNMLSFTAEFRPKNTANFFYLYRYDVDNRRNDASILGANYIRLFNRHTVSLSYFFSDDNRIAKDADRFVIALNNLLHKTRNESALRLSSSFSSETDWSEGRTLNEKLSYSLPVSSRSNAMVAYSFGYSLNLDDHIYNQYNAVYNYTLNKQTQLSLDYLFVDKVYSYLLGGVPFDPDDDSVARLSLVYKY